MPVQATSIEAFEKIIDDLGERQALVYALFNAPEVRLTNSEIAQRLGWSINCVTPRVYELRRMGLLTYCGKKPCSITGRSAIVWGRAYFQDDLFGGPADGKN